MELYDRLILATLDDVTQAHIHLARWARTAVEHLRTGNAYVKVHTNTFPPGDIRGQLG